MSVGFISWVSSFLGTYASVYISMRYFYLVLSNLRARNWVLSAGHIVHINLIYIRLVAVCAAEVLFWSRLHTCTILLVKLQRVICTYVSGADSGPHLVLGSISSSLHRWLDKNLLFVCPNVLTTLIWLVAIEGHLIVYPNLRVYNAWLNLLRLTDVFTAL